MNKLSIFGAIQISIALIGFLATTVHSAPLRLADINNGTCYPRVSAGPNNSVYVVWHDNDKTGPSGADSIFFRRSLDGGKSFEEKQEIEKDASPDLSVSQPQIAVDTDGTIYVIYCKYDIENEQFSLLLNKSEDDGASFERQTIYTDVIDVIFLEENYAFSGADIKIAEGSIYYAWSGQHEVFLARSDDGNQFEVIEVQQDGDGDSSVLDISKILPSLTVDSNHKLHVAWFEDLLEENQTQFRHDLYSATLEHQEGQFSESRKLGEVGVSGEIMGQPSVVTYSEQTVVIAWNTPDGTSMISSDDGGDSFSDPTITKLGIDTSTKILKAVVDQSDVGHFLYLSKNNAALYYSSSSDSGQSYDISRKIASISAMADMHWDEKEEIGYIVWLNPKTESVYFANSLEEADPNPNDPTDPEPAMVSSGGGGGGGCLIHSILK